jgi:hypothetical protein
MLAIKNVLEVLLQNSVLKCLAPTTLRNALIPYEKQQEKTIKNILINISYQQTNYNKQIKINKILQI